MVSISPQQSHLSSTQTGSQEIDGSMSASLDSQCPSCHRRFSNESLVLRHMNNPRTSCMTWFDFLESMSPERPHSPANRHTSPDDGTNNNDTDNEAANNSNMSATTRYEDIHPNTPFIFGSGPGFMDTFNTDRHAEKRRGNLYYPFSSKAEWGLASWLLCSGLSMKSIDSFLALPIVSHEKCIVGPSLIGNQGPTAFTLLRNRKNTTQPHGRSSQGPCVANAGYSY